MRRRAPVTDPAALVERSISRYRRRHRDYEQRHPEIFNDREQARLRTALERAVAEIEPAAGGTGLALDLGCGSGNVTRHLLALELEVLAADVSPEFLAGVDRRFAHTGRVRTLRLNGLDLAGIDTGAVDIACAYSVLHHIPDYAAAVDELCRVVRPGGVIYLDHEANDAFYDPDGCFRSMLRELERHRRERPGLWNPDRRRWQRALVPATHAERLRRLLNPAHPWDAEGDIHVWEFDRVDWTLVERRLGAGGCTVVHRSDYLNYSLEYPEDVWRRYAGTCTNMRLVVARRSGEPPVAGTRRAERASAG